MCCDLAILTTCKHPMWLVLYTTTWATHFLNFISQVISFQTYLRFLSDVYKWIQTTGHLTVDTFAYVGAMALFGHFTCFQTLDWTSPFSCKGTRESITVMRLCSKACILKRFTTLFFRLCYLAQNLNVCVHSLSTGAEFTCAHLIQDLPWAGHKPKLGVNNNHYIYTGI